MRIAFTPDAFATQRYGGVTRYVTELALQLDGVDDCDIALLGMAHFNEHLRETSLRRGRIVARYIPHIRFTGRLRRRLNTALARRYLTRHPVDIVHETYYAHRTAAPRGVKVVLTVYDMTHERFPESFSPTDRTSDVKHAAVQRADHIVCISDATRRDLIELLGVDRAKTSVVHLGSSLRAPSAALRRAPPSSAAPFLLFVGDRAGYKNFSRLLQALPNDLELVCFGGAPLRSDELDSRKRVTQLSGGDELLAQLYSTASALVYPSRSEGFGLPVLEAMACGCPVACANVSSLPELAGDAAELFDPMTPTDIARAIEAVMAPARAAELRERGRKRATLFTWERCAEQTLAVYRRVLGSALSS